MNTPLLQLEQVSKSFHTRPTAPYELFRWRRPARLSAIEQLDLTVHRGETLCVVGESGCGKSTMARLVMGLLHPDEGQINYAGQRIDHLRRHDRMPYRRRMQMIFQDPYTALNPRLTVLHCLLEALLYHQPQLTEQEALELAFQQLLAVGIDPALGQRFPHQLSSGQRQRLNIARALIVKPEFIVADEPLSALDVSIQAQILNLLQDTASQQGLTFLFFTHNLAVVEHIADRVAVMYEGRLCELTSRRHLFKQPRHPYTQALLEAMPQLTTNPQDGAKLLGDVPSRLQRPLGCSLQDRCPYANERCRHQVPTLFSHADGGQTACHAIQEGRLMP